MRRGQVGSAGRVLPRLLLIMLAALVSAGVATSDPRPADAAANVLPRPRLDVAPPPPGAVRVVAAGDIARCDGFADEATAALVEQVDGPVLALGDLAYEEGTATDFAHCYGPSWGRFRDRTYPVPGNHEYRSQYAGPYFDYFGARAGRPGLGWYSTDIGGWHVVALNSNCGEVGGCHEASAQHRWLQEDLAQHPAQCTLAFWHHPLVSSSVHHERRTRATAFWEVLHEHGADVVLGGHEHSYERFAALDPAGRVDPSGIRQFVVGTGGGALYGFAQAAVGSEARIDAYGVLLLDLAPGGYQWQFVDVWTGRAADAGQGRCH
jgi:3',5'-cyclic AMP phosphodiesterase CpdA